MRGMWESVYVTTVVVFGFAVNASNGQGIGGVQQLVGVTVQHRPQGNLDPRNWSHGSGGIARPASYTYISSNARDASATLLQVNQPTVHSHHGFSQSSRQLPNGQVVTPKPYRAPQFPVASQTGLAFPVKPVLPGNALTLEKGKFPGVLRVVSSYSGVTQPSVPLAPSPLPRVSKEKLVVTHNAITSSPIKDKGLKTSTITSSPIKDKGLKMSTQTRITNDDMYAELGGQPIRDFKETIHNTKADKGNVFERMQHVRVHQGEDGSLAKSLVEYKTGDVESGGDEGEHELDHEQLNEEVEEKEHESELEELKEHESEHGEGKEHKSEHGEETDKHHHTVKGEKGEKGYKKEHKHHKGGKGHHDKEHDSANYEEKLKKENKHFKGEAFYGEHHKAKKEGKGKKYGEGGKHKKGHSTHGEHNIVKKDEFIKSTKFYDEDHNGGAHEEHSEFYGHQTEKKGGSKEGGHKVSDLYEKNAGKESHHDKGHVDEDHKGHESGEGHDSHYHHGVEYGNHKGGHSSKTWGHSSGNKH